MATVPGTPYLATTNGSSASSSTLLGTTADNTAKATLQRHVGSGILCITLPLWLPALLLVGLPTYAVNRLWKLYGPISSKIEQPPLPTPRRRRRALSVSAAAPPFTTSTVSAATNPESKASSVSSSDVKPGKEDGKVVKECGFWKLPLEIREQIWEELLVPDGDIWIVFLEGNKRRRLCATTVPRGERNAHIAVTESEMAPIHTNLLKTNRRFYQEGIDMLYTRNRFHIYQANVLTSFARTVPSQRLASIRHLHFDVRHLLFHAGFSGLETVAWNERIWRRACKYLPSFTNLRTLKISIRVHQASGKCIGWVNFGEDIWRKPVLEPLLDPLAQLSARDQFVVEYPWPEKVCHSWPRATFDMVKIQG